MKKNEEMFFLILYRRKEKEMENDFVFKKGDITPKNIYTKEIEEKGQKKTYLYEKVFKNEGKPSNEENEIQFELDKDIYIISFSFKDQSFIYDIELKKLNNFENKIAKEIIDQNFLDYYQKFELFLEALNKNKEEEKINILYNETIQLCSKKKRFTLFASLFTKVYNNKNLCSKLIKEFYEINKDIKNEKIMDKNEGLKHYISTFSNISSQAENLIENNDYDIVQFYGIILCYLNNYDYENFKKYFIKLYKNNYKDLFEILLTYDSVLLNPIC
jgi:hypothetical protein